uniref:Roadblock/LAMTOR2 domain-containing protein n=1 Tax=Neogobius melanostomus TaxID=47308 RepID=A0A8C6TF87_9GOBI
MGEVEETMRKLVSQKGVQGVIIGNFDGLAIRTTMDDATTQQYMGTIHPLLILTKATLNDMGPISQASGAAQSTGDLEEDNLWMLRLRTEKNEILIAPDKEFFVITIQDTSN